MGQAGILNRPELCLSQPDQLGQQLPRRANGGAFFLGLALSEPRTPPGRNGPGGVPYGAGRRALIRRQVKDKLFLFTRLCIESHTPSTGIHGPPRVQTPYSQLGEAERRQD